MNIEDTTKKCYKCGYILEGNPLQKSPCPACGSKPDMDFLNNFAVAYEKSKKKDPYALGDFLSTKKSNDNHANAIVHKIVLGMEDTKKRVDQINIFSIKSNLPPVPVLEPKIKDKEKLGNTIGNIINFGYACENDHNTFFINKNDDFAIYCNEKLLNAHKTSGHISVYINVKDGYVYYVNLINDGLYTMTTEGEDIKKIHRRKLRNVIVYGDYIYAIDKGYKLRKIDCKTHKEATSGNLEKIKTSFIAPMNDFIYFSNIDRKNYLYKIHVGGERYPVLVCEKSCRHIVTDSDEKIVYFIGKEDHKLYKLNEPGAEEVVVDRLCKTMNLLSTTIYYVTEDGHLHEKTLSRDREIPGRYYDINLTEDEILYHDGIDYHKKKISSL
ncbi:MAG: DUF5050 domain-containing protein [Defluviitaleaceae bacterium]|nr:DUF5050 domain-containing protein [Defluviitaleaceae bacterium]